MKLPDALPGIVLLGIDSTPLIYLVEQHPDYLDMGLKRVSEIRVLVLDELEVS